MIGSSKAADGEEFFDNLVSDESQASPAESLDEDDFRLAPLKSDHLLVPPRM